MTTAIEFEKIDGMICAPFTAFRENGELNLAIIPAYETVQKFNIRHSSTTPSFLRRQESSKNTQGFSTANAIWRGGSCTVSYAEMLVEHGMVGAFVNGSSGEGHLMTDAERRSCAEKWREAAPAGFKLIIHVGSNCCRGSADLARHARDIDAWAIAATAPTFPCVTHIEELLQYCQDIAAGAPELPFYFYHIPAFTNVNLPMLPLLEAVNGRIPNFAGIKHTFESLYEYTQCRRYQQGKFDLLHGQDETLLAALALGGATGCIGGTFNYAANLYTGIRAAFGRGDLQKARELQFKAMDMIDVIVKYRGNIVAGKQTMKLIGLDLGPNRAPIQNLTGDEFSALKADLTAVGFFDYHNRL